MSAPEMTTPGAGGCMAFAGDIVLLDFGFGEFIDGISYFGNDNSGYVDPDGWWHYWTGNAGNGLWTASEIGAGDRLVSDGHRLVTDGLRRFRISTFGGNARSCRFGSRFYECR